MNPLTKFWQIGRGVGWDNIPRRLRHSWDVRSGSLARRTGPKLHENEKCPLWPQNSSERLAAWRERKSKFFPVPSPALLRELSPETIWQKDVAETCLRALDGSYPMFSHNESQLGWPPNFNRDAENEIVWPVGEHWLQSARSGPPRDDIKLVWEPNRFTLAFFLARAYAYDSNERWAEAFWEMLNAWLEQNPYNHSVAWGCGQEAAIRLFAMLFGAIVTLDSQHASDEALQRLEAHCWRTGHRIAANINYAISQENNHALSEATCLYTLGLLFPEFPESGAWYGQGRQTLIRECRRQIYDDGSYVQHSFSYHRVMLDDLCWAIQLGRLSQKELPHETTDRCLQAARWLAEFVEPSTGRVPNYGANDGANLLPLSCSDYLDYRPTVDSAFAACDREQATFGAGPWQEKALWLTGKVPSAPSKLKRTACWKAEQGGYYILRGPNSYLFTRAAKFRDRPSQCDALHVDLWAGSINVLRDAGSYRYYHRDANVKNYFYSASAHNTVSVPTRDQMIKGPNFLWFYWSETDVEVSNESGLVCEANFPGPDSYRHRRSIQRMNDAYTIKDCVAPDQDFQICWRLAPELVWELSESGLLVGDNDLLHCELQLSGQYDAAELTTAPESLYYSYCNRTPCLLVHHCKGSITTSISLLPTTGCVSK